MIRGEWCEPQREYLTKCRGGTWPARYKREAREPPVHMQEEDKELLMMDDV